jgi:hypothetical protein
METRVAYVRVDMGAVSPDDDGKMAAVAEMLRRERPTPTFDELQRVDRRLVAARAPRRARRGLSRLAVMACLSVGLLFTTAGSGLALSGYATPGPAVHAQYPDSTPGQASTPTAEGAPSKPHARPHASSPSLGVIRSTGASSTRYVSLAHAETDNELPFTGFAAIPVLLAGITLIAAGAVIHRRTRTR